MFEQSMLQVRPSGARGASFAMSVTLQCALVGAALLVPLLVTDQIRPVQLFIGLTSPPPPAGPRMAVERSVQGGPAGGRIIVPYQPSPFRAPGRIPAAVNLIADEAPGGTSIAGGNEFGVPGGTGDPRLAPGSGVGGVGTLLPPPPLPPPHAPPRPVAAPKPMAPIVVGGQVQAAKLLNPMVPAYPALARQARISGVVRLAALIGRDGRIVNLQVVSGHPLLVKAAVDAVRQWTYSPTLLNEVPVEVSTSVDVYFTLQ